jgi:hypothetical protein
MLICERCQSEANILNDAKVWDDQALEREHAALCLGWESQYYFPGRWLTLRVCWRCRLSLGYKYAFSNFSNGKFYAVIDGDQDSLPTEVVELFDRLAHPVVIEASEPILDRPIQTKPGTRQTPFRMRVLQSSVAALLVKALFEECGYEVRPSGYEQLVPEWVSAMRAADPNLAVMRVRTAPDLQVYDRELNSLYEVEIKATSQKPPRWSYRKDRLDTLRYLHPEAILVVYAQQVHKLFVQRVGVLDWDSLPVGEGSDGAFYKIDLTGFVSPPELFRLVTGEYYLRFLEDSKAVLRDFQPQD